MPERCSSAASPAGTWPPRSCGRSANTCLARPLPHIRTVTETLIDTGRRPEDVAALPLDCLTSGADGALMLAYDKRVRNARAERPGWERKPGPKDPSRNNQVQRTEKLLCLPVDREFSSGGREKYFRSGS